MTWPGWGANTAASTTDSLRKSGRSSSSASRRSSSSAIAGSSARISARRRGRNSGSSSSSSSSRGDRVAQRSESMPGLPGSALQGCQQEHARLLPVPSHAAFGALEQAGDLAFGQAGEIAHLDHLGQARVQGVQLVQGHVQAQHVLVQAHAAAGVLGQVGDPVQVAAALHRHALAGVVHHHRAHGAGGVGEEVGTVLELGLGAAGQLQVGLVHQGGGIQGMALLLAAQLAPGHAVQFPVKGGQHPVQRRFVALPGCSQPLGDFCGLVHDSPGPVLVRAGDTIAKSARGGDSGGSRGRLGFGAPAQNVTYIHTDALGSPVLETNAQAQVVRQVDYRAYGMEIMDAPRPGPGYTGHYRDVGTGLVYMQQRYYDPVVGRFLSADPVATDTKNGWNLNRYNYAANNPYKFTDPDGREIRIIGSEEFVKRIEAQLADAEAASTKIADMVGGLRDSANVHEIRDISESPRNQLQSHNIATDPSGR